MENINAIGIDLAKNVFQICAVNGNGRVLFNRQVKRTAVLSTLRDISPTTIAIEGCASSHYWAEQFESLGHKVRLIPAQHVKAFVRGHKHDANDAAALAEVATRDDLPETLRKTLWQRNIQFMVRRRERRVRSRVRLVNQLRGLLYEHGIVVGRSVVVLKRRLPEIMMVLDNAQSPLLPVVQNLVEEFDELQLRIKLDEKTLKTIAHSNETCIRLMQIHGIGYLNAVSLVEINKSV